MREATWVGRGLGRAFGRQPRWLYRGLDLTPAPGRVLVIVGPNGAGKSTLLRDLVGLRRPMEGSVALEGRDLSHWAPLQRAQQIAFLPQRPDVPEALTVERLVALGRVPHQGWWGRPQPRDRVAVARAMRMVEVEGLAERRVESLSGGEIQRVMLARMLATEAPILVLDEPTSALDLRHALHGLEVLRALAQHGRTVVLSLHELDWARRFGDDALVLAGDGTFEQGAASAILDPGALGRVFGVSIAVDAHGTLRATLPAEEQQRILEAVGGRVPWG